MNLFGDAAFVRIYMLSFVRISKKWLGEGRERYRRGAFMEGEECEILEDTGGKETYDTENN